MYLKKIGKKALSMVLIISMVGGLSACGTSESQKMEEAVVEEQELTLTTSGYDSKYFDENGNMKLPLSDGTETFKVLWRKDPEDKGTIEDKYMLQEALKATGIKLEVEEVSDQGWDEKISVLFASGDLPDVICGRIPNLVNFTDQCLDVTDLLPKYAPFMTDFLYNQYPSAVKAEAFDGRLYSLPHVRIHNIYPRYFWSINTEWLERVGMDIPTTTEELYEVLKAFKEQDANGNGDPNDEIPYSFVGTGDESGLLSFMNSFGMINDGASKSYQFIMVENGKIIFTPTDQRFYDMLKYMNRLYSEGLMDQDGLIQDSADRYTKGTADRIGFFSNSGLNTTIVGNEVGEHCEYILPVASEYGSVIYQNDPPAELDNHVFTITKNCKNPELLIMLAEYMNSTSDNRFYSRFGQEGTSWVMTEDGKAANASDFTGKSYSTRVQATATVGVGWRFPVLCTAEEEDRREYVGSSIPYNDVGRNLYGPSGGHAYPESFPLGNDTLDNSTKRSEMFAEIDTYIQNFVAESVTTGIDDAKWEEHLENCRKLGQEEFVKSYQELYDKLMQ